MHLLHRVMLNYAGKAGEAVPAATQRGCRGGDHDGRYRRRRGADREARRSPPRPRAAVAAGTATAAIAAVAGQCTRKLLVL